MRIQISLLAAAAIAVVTGTLGGLTSHASATPLCYSATVSTFATGTTTVGPDCLPYIGPTDCQPGGTSLGTLFAIDGSACVPAPINPLSRTAL